MLGLRFCARTFSSCGKQGPLFIAVRGPPTTAAFLVVGHRLQMCRLSSCGSQAQLLRGMWDLHRPGLEPVSHALAGRFSTTAPPGKPKIYFLKHGRNLTALRFPERERHHTSVGKCPQYFSTGIEFQDYLINYIACMFNFINNYW